ncbi:MAG: phosphatase PAP2 family protein [Candidatus Jordarchaeales archaeon]
MKWGRKHCGGRMDYWWDLSVIHWIQGSFWTPWGFMKAPSLLDGVMWVVTQFGTETVWILVVSALFWLGYRKESLLLGALVLLEAMINFWLKYAIFRLRPTRYEAFIFYESSDPSMPSGHAQLAATASFYTSRVICLNLESTSNVARESGRSWFSKKCFALYSLALTLTVLVSLSRIYLGVHWPTDVIAGSAIGFTIFIVYSLTAEKLWGIVAPRLPTNTLCKCILVALLGVAIGIFTPSSWGIGWYAGGFFTGFFTGAVLETDAVKLEKPMVLRKALGRLIIGGLVLFVLAVVADKVSSGAHALFDLAELLLKFFVIPSSLSPWTEVITSIILEPYMNMFFSVVQFPLYILIGLWISFIAPYMFKAFRL